MVPVSEKTLFKKIRPALVQLIKAIVIVHISIIALFLLLSAGLALSNPKVTSLMLYRSVFFRQKIRPVVYLPIKKIPDVFQQMVVHLEDDSFYNHWGIDPSAISYAWTKNQGLGHRKYGGSTITQQLARTLFLIPKKWYIRKYLEAWLAVEMDLILSKNRILELYLNYAEWGKGVFGIGEAARYYYGRNLSDLTLDEMKRLAAILPNPLRYKPHSLDNRIAFPGRYNELSNFTDFNSLTLSNEAVPLSLTNPGHASNIVMLPPVSADSAVSNTIPGINPIENTIE